MNTRVEQAEIWIAMANVQVDKNNSSIKDAGYAYVNVLGLAKSKIDFRKNVANELSSLKLKLLRLENAERFKERVAKYKVEDSIHVLVKELLDGDAKIKFSTFHTYD